MSRDGEVGRQRGYAKRMGVTEKGILGDDDMAAIAIQKAWKRNRLRKGLREQGA